MSRRSPRGVSRMLHVTANAGHSAVVAAARLQKRMHVEGDVGQLCSATAKAFAETGSFLTDTMKRAG